MNKRQRMKAAKKKFGKATNPLWIDPEMWGVKNGGLYNKKPYPTGGYAITNEMLQKAVDACKSIEKD